MDIKSIASQVWDDDSGKPWSDSALHHLEKFAELILEQERKEAAEHYLGLIRDCIETEREACAKVCDEHLLLGNKCAAAIRARGDKHD